MGPRADFFCVRCEDKGLCSPENPWRDLPIKKPKCPECGASRWMRRLYAGYSPAIAVRQGTEAIRSTHEQIQYVDQMTEAVRERQQAPAKSFEVAHGFGVKAVSLGNVGAEVGRLAAHTAGESAGAMTAAAVQSSVKVGTSRAKTSLSAELASAGAPPLKAPHRRPIVAASWTPSASELAAARA